ncbi:MAG: hypothetical protein RDU01_03570 [Thermodesulfovibrionales bacterium]|nr:hypothetical protein [Thermodesulfovibrionales bacterium]
MLNTTAREDANMAKAKKVKQLSFETKDKIGMLSAVTAAIAAAKVDITATCAYGMDRDAYFMLITSSNAKAKKALGKLGIPVEEEDVVLVELPNRPGALQQVAKKIADSGINIQYMYATAASGKTSTGVLATDNDAKAVKVINK